MVESSISRVSNLRERKKARTRRILVDAAVDLCLKQGYHETTVDQICEVAEISTRTFNRYFATKDAVFIAVIDDFAVEIAAELRAQPPAVGPMESLRAAHAAVLTRVAKGLTPTLTADRIVLMLKIVYSSDALRQAAIDYRGGPAMEALAEKMGVEVGDKRMELAVSLFTTTIVAACSDLVVGTPDVTLGPEAVLERLERTLGQVAELTADLKLS
ncbi:MAG: TetR family transcriptional regulator [Mycobacterium sp.]